MYVGHVVFLVTRHCVWNVWYSLSLSLPVSSKCYSLSFITNCIQPVLAWHARPSVLFSYGTCSCFSAATLQPYATQTSPISVSVRSFPSSSSASSSFPVSSTYLSVTCSGLTGILLFGLVGLWVVLICFDVVTHVLVPNASPCYTLSRWRGVKNQSFISVSVTLLGWCVWWNEPKTPVSISRGEVVITVFSFGCRQVLMNRRRSALDWPTIVHRPLLELKDVCSTDYAMLFLSK